MNTPLFDQLDRHLDRIQQHLLSLQQEEGYWWANLESNVTMTAEAILLYKIWGIADRLPLAKAERYLRQEQREHGGWELYYGDGGELSVSIEAYMALRLLGVAIDDPALKRARQFILDRGGITQSRIFTKFHLALIGCYDWSGLPSIPAWVMLLPDGNDVFSIYDLSSWARGSTVPLIVVFDRKPVYIVEPIITLNELYAEGIANARFELPRDPDADPFDFSNLNTAFTALDDGFKLGERLGLVPFREEGLRQAEQWILERQEATGDWGGIIPAMLNSMLALRVLGYAIDDPEVVRGFAALDRFSVQTDETYWMQPCISPVWDTAWMVRALVELGLDRDAPELCQAGQWLVDRQILDYGDWAVKNPDALPGGWAFEFDNRFYPDLDDSAVVAMAIDQVALPDAAHKQAVVRRGVDWMMSMQCRGGGWAAFDIDNDKEWLNDLPYSDLKASIDPPTADVTARVLELVGELTELTDTPDAYSSLLEHHQDRIDAAIDYLLAEQESDGSWFGRWGVNYIYGTSGVLSALAYFDRSVDIREAIGRGALWLIQMQNDDGGWGESCASYVDPHVKGQGVSTASQTAWAMIGLLAAAPTLAGRERAALDRGVQYLIETQCEDGSWSEAEYTGTGFPCHFYLNYRYYPLYFPAIALARYRATYATEETELQTSA